MPIPMRKYFLAPLLIVFVALTSGLLPASAWAVNYGGVGAVPAYPVPGNPRTQSIFIYELKPGQTANDGVKVLNDTNQTQVITLDAVDSELASGGTFTCRQAAEPKTDVGAWITLQETSVTLAPNSSKIVPFSITVPDSGSVSVGEHDGCITVQAASQTSAESTKAGILLSFRSAIRVVVTVPGKIVKDLAINNVRVNGMDSNGMYKIAITVNNDGNVSLDAKVNTSLQSILGIQTKNTNNGITPILPHSTAVLNYTISRPFWGGWYSVRTSVSYNKDPSTELGMGSNSDLAIKIRDSAVFFALPTAAGGAVESVILVAIIVALYWIIRKRSHAKHVKTHWIEYKVKKNDTLESLASNSGTSWRKIAQVNKLKAPYNLRKDQILKLPEKKK